MTDQGLNQHIDALLREAFERAGVPAEFAVGTPSARPDLADWQCNGALAASKQARRAPREIAEAVVRELSSAPEFEAVSVAGPGFINFTLSSGFLRGAMLAQLRDAALGVPQAEPQEPVILDFGGPNMAKPLHVGHLRSLVIGESVRRILVQRGFNVLSDVHLGDWGLQMGMLISEIEKERPDLPHFGPAGAAPGDSLPVSLNDMERLYTKAAADCREDPERLERAREVTAQLQSGHEGYLSLWRQLREASLDALRPTFAELGAHFDLLEGESDVAPLIDPMVRDLTERGIAVESQGALVIPVAAPDDTHQIPPLLLVKADGAALYSTTDLATIVGRIDRHRPRRILYVVDQRQSLHFEQVFRAAEIAGIFRREKMVHIGFGTVNGKDNKPYKTREGGVMRLADLIAEAAEKARERLAESRQAGGGEAQQGRDDLAQEIGIAAIKFADLSSVRTSGYIFDADRLVSFEGKTGPYLQYACVRLNSILGKAGAEADEAPETFHLDPEARAVVIEALRFPEAVLRASEQFLPNEIAEHAFTLAQKFSRFYTNCPVLQEADRDIRLSRIAICRMTHEILSRDLWLLGISIPAKM